MASYTGFNSNRASVPTINISTRWRAKAFVGSLGFYALLQFLLFCSINNVLAQTNPHHVKVSGYYRSNGTYVQPYFRTAPNSTNRDNFSTKGNTNPYTGKPGWIDPDSKYDKLYYSTYTYTPATEKTNSETDFQLPQMHKERTYVQDEVGNYTCYLTVKDKRSFNIYDLKDELILLLVINHRGDWRIFDSSGIYIKTIFVVTESENN